MTNVNLKLLRAILVCAVGRFACVASAAPPPPPAELQSQYASTARPLIERYCLSCHSTKLKKGDLDLERFTALDQMRHDVKPFQQMIEMLESEEMPPKKKPQPTAAERRQLIGWTRSFLDAEALASAGDPGYVPLRRLSNTEYDCTIRDLAGIDLRPTREFPPDGAAGEGFTNAAEALTDVSPALLSKYLAAAKDVADHAVLLPDGFRFSRSKTRRDWTDESTARLREFYAEYGDRDGRLDAGPYLAAAIRNRDALAAGTLAPREVAARERLNPNYFAALYRVLTDPTASYPLDQIRARWRSASPEDAPQLARDVAAWQAALWKTSRVGSYMRPEGKGYVENLARQVPNDPPAAQSVPLRVAFKPSATGAAEVVLRLESHDLANGAGGRVVWSRPRFEAQGKAALFLRDYPDYGATFETDPRSLFADASRYLAAAADAAGNATTVDTSAKNLGLDPALLKRWIEILGIARTATGDPSFPASAVALKLLDEPATGLGSRPPISGWHKKGTDLPVVVANDSDKAEQIPGHVSAHGVAVHPMPREFVGVTWTSPVTADVRVAANIAHAHPACGNGVAWWIEQRRDGRSRTLAEGLLDLGQQVTPNARTIKVRAGDQLLLAIDARDGDPACDLTEIGLTVTDDRQPAAVTWDLASDVSRSITAGNPHADTHGNADVWRFVRGDSTARRGAGSPTIPSNSVLGSWRVAATDPARADEASRLAARVQTLLSGARPPTDKDPDTLLYDKLVNVEGPLLGGIDLAKLGKRIATRKPFGILRGRFGGGGVDDASLAADAGAPIDVHIPTALLAGREFVVDARLEARSADRVVQPRVRVAPSDADNSLWDGATPLLASPTGPGYAAVTRGCAEFRQVFPLFLCFPNVVPNDEVVSLKMFHREDEPLVRLFLDADQRRRLEQLWTEHRFVSRQPVAENDYLPLFIGFVTQDQPRAMVDYFEGQRPAFRQRADAFLKEEEAAIPKQLETLLEFASRAMRRPPGRRDRDELLALYHTLRDGGAGHDEAFRGVLARVLVSPAFLFRIEHAPPGKDAGLVNDWELATRLSYFLWSSSPDEALRALAAQNRLHEPDVLSAQVRRMLQDPRLRALAVEFGTQWIHVRGFDQFNDKNQALFPTFDDDLRRSMYEESILFFQDLFQRDRPVTDVVNADYTFLNESLAKHYGIPDVIGPQWRRVEGVRKYQRGGVLGLGSVQARQAGASRTSPVLRGNWVVETLLGERLPRPPADVPKLPEAEGADGLTMRQEVERHTKDPACATCHVRIDPFGFAFEGFDAVGRLRSISTPGAAPADTHARLKDATEFDGIDGLRNYLVTRKKEVVVRLFCRRLLGYALGRSVVLSDQPLIDQMMSELEKNDGRVTAAVQVIVASRQFRMIRGSDYAD